MSATRWLRCFDHGLRRYVLDPARMVYACPVKDCPAFVSAEVSA